MDAAVAQDVVVSDCIIHQENLCTNVFALAEAMKNVVQCVNYIRARGLSNRQFKAFLEYLDCDYPDVVYFSAVRWLCSDATLKRFWNMLQEIKVFMESKHKYVAFLSDENWMDYLEFLTDITPHLSELNLKLQGKSQVMNKLFQHICAFWNKLELFQVHLVTATLTNFMCLAATNFHQLPLDMSFHMVLSCQCWSAGGGE